MQTKIYVVTHKQTYIPDNECYVPIIVGNHSVSYDNAVHDNTGINISQKNPSYCELTALYWIWKNVQDEGYYGLSHYRRYFVNRYCRNSTFFDHRKIRRYFRKYDIVLPFPQYWNPHTVGQQLLESSMRQHNYDLIKCAIARLYPDYLPSFETVFSSHYASYCNMFILPKKAMLDDYCKWLFDILFEIEMHVDLSGASDYEKRIYGFISERLLNVWVHKNALKVKYLEIHDGKTKSSKKRLFIMKLEAINSGVYKGNLFTKLLCRMLFPQHPTTT